MGFLNSRANSEGCKVSQDCLVFGFVLIEACQPAPKRSTEANPMIYLTDFAHLDLHHSRPSPSMYSYVAIPMNQLKCPKHKDSYSLAAQPNPIRETPRVTTQFWRIGTPGNSSSDSDVGARSYLRCCSLSCELGVFHTSTRLASLACAPMKITARNGTHHRSGLHQRHRHRRLHRLRSVSHPGARHASSQIPQSSHFQSFNTEETSLEAFKHYALLPISNPSLIFIHTRPLPFRPSTGSPHFKVFIP